MLETTPGLVLHTLRYSDSSVIAKIYTRTAGLQSFMVRGVGSRKKNRKAALLQPLSMVEVTSRVKPGQMQTARDLRLHKAYTKLHMDVTKCSVALFLAEVLYRSLREEVKNESLYDFLEHACELLDSEENVGNFHLWFLLRLSQFLGFQPHPGDEEEISCFDFREGVFRNMPPLHGDFVENPTAQAIRDILGMNFVGIKGFAMSSEQRREVLDALLLYYRTHLPGMKEVKAHHVLQTVLH